MCKCEKLGGRLHVVAILVAIALAVCVYSEVPSVAYAECSTGGDSSGTSMYVESGDSRLELFADKKVANCSADTSESRGASTDGGGVHAAPQVISRELGVNSEYDCLDLYPGADAGGDATGCSGTTNACAAANLLNILSGEGEGYVSTETVRVSADQSSEELLGFDCRARGGTPEAGGGEAAEPVVITVSLSDFQAMPVEPLVASAGPDDGWLPVHMVNVLHTDDEMQSLATEVLGVSVEVRAVPVSFHWDLGDGSTITTSTAGAPYPSEEITAEYAFEGWYDVTLTTTFSGQFSVAGGEWQDIDGTIEVASDPVPIYSKSLESRLVDGAVPVDEEGDPWVPERTAETEGPQDPDATHREI